MKTEIMREKFKILTVLITGCLVGLMVAMMCAGGAISFRDFLQAGNLYEWSQKELQTSNEKWVYQEESSCFRIAAPEAEKKFLIDKKTGAWTYLYADVDKLSVESLQIELRYYNRAGKVVYTQPFILFPGENIIGLNPGVPVFKLGFYLENAQGVSVSLASMQVRQKFTAYSLPKIALAVAGTVGAFFFFCLLWRKHTVGNKKKGENKVVTLFFTLYDYVFSQFAADMSRKIGKKSENDRRTMQRLLFSLFFLWSIAGNVWGWTVGTYYRYHLLVCAVFLVLLGISCKKDVEKKIKWNTPIACAWLFLWIGMNISDFAVVRQNQFQGYVMLFAAGFFIYRWNRMCMPLKLFEVIMEALEIVFFESVLFCLLFRPKLPAVQYNGVFKNPEESAMFALLMLVVFGVQLERSVFQKKGRKQIFLYILGIAFAVYLVLRAENRVGYIVMAILFLVFGYRFLLYKEDWRRWIKSNRKKILASGVLSFVIVLGFYAGTKVLPEELGLSWKYTNEAKLSQKSEQTLSELTNVSPELTRGVVREADIEKAVIQKSYLRQLNLWGNSGTVRVFRQYASAYNGYLYMAYRYGIFILVPYVMYQIIAFWISLDCLRTSGKRRKRKNVTGEEQVKLWQLGILIIYIGFSISGNAEVVLGHPLWLCVYLCFGCWFEEPKQEIQEGWLE